MRRLLSIALFASLSVLLFSCKKDKIEDISVPEITGTITGKVVSPNNRTPIRYALVFISTAKKLYSTYTDLNGNFSLTAAAGTAQNLHVQTGNGDKFRSVILVDVVANQTTPLTDLLRLNQVGNFAFLAGSYDKIENILIDSLGYNAQSINSTNIQYIAGISNFDVLFINCGAYNAFVSPNTDTALSNFVSGGGSLYLSDFSMEFLTGQSALTDCQVPRYNGFIPDATVCSRRTGGVSVVPNAQVVSPELQYYLGKDSMRISYNLGSWERIQAIDDNFWQTMVTDPTDNSPLLIRTNQYNNGNINLPFVGSRDTSQVTICHQLGNGNSITITVDANAVAAHIAHGDSMGMCNNPYQSGWIYYTTFHNEHNGQVSEDVKHILEFMILNL